MVVIPEFVLRRVHSGVELGEAVHHGLVDLVLPLAAVPQCRVVLDQLIDVGLHDGVYAVEKADAKVNSPNEVGRGQGACYE